MVGCYGDDSSDSKSKNVITAAAFFDWPVQIFEADRRWTNKLDTHGLQYFKASECEGVRGEFQRFRSDRSDTLEQAHAKADAIRNEFISIIDVECKLSGLAITLVRPDFEEVISTNAKARLHYGTDSTILVYRSLIRQVVHTIRDEYHSQPVAFLFDDHSNYRKAEEAYDQLRDKDEDCGRIMGSVGHASDIQHNPLQMADLLAHEARHRTVSIIDHSNLVRLTFTRLDSTFFLLAVIDKASLLAGLTRQDTSTQLAEPGLVNPYSTL